MTRSDMEKAIEEKVTKGEMSCGLYQAGVAFVSVYLGGEDWDTVKFDWFNDAQNIYNYIPEEQGS